MMRRLSVVDMGMTTLGFATARGNLSLYPAPQIVGVAHCPYTLTRRAVLRAVASR